ncbi:hypothetical protein HPB50_008141 [Hyalomma asiaticum]|uniref:Uncharacterized protein n=1 Tax=Hyalomma asiaticum TaxID=266040 RepID=A0ACB7TJ35_HYAAI|nr:hypothetical protein HPB50_008141 [Hyalomma asiaticum]
MAAKQGGKSKRATKKRRQLQAPNKPGTPTGGVGKQSSTPPPPHGGTGEQPTSKPSGEAGSWAKANKNVNQVSGTGRAASSFPLSVPLRRITVLENQISAAVNAAIAKMTEAIPILIAQVARFNKRARPIKDVSG